jgi:hypothetical protein
VERETNEVLAAAPDLASAHLVHHINFTHHRDFAGALHSLHNYFDLPAGRNGSAIIDGGCGLDGLQSSSSDAAPSSARRTGPKAFQHATLNLAAAHHAFGHTAEALIALDEAVRVAQQRDDHRCVAMARTWRLRIVTSRGNAAATEAAFARCLESALELNMIELAVVAALSLARHRLASATCGAAAVLHELLAPGTPRATARAARGALALLHSALRASLPPDAPCRRAPVAYEPAWQRSPLLFPVLAAALEATNAAASMELTAARTATATFAFSSPRRRNSSSDRFFLHFLVKCTKKGAISAFSY